jgi:hypothetical protein
MRRTLALVFSFAVLPLLAGYHGSSHEYRGHRSEVSISTREYGEPITRCDQIEVRVDGDRVPMIEEDVPAGGLRSLRIHAPRNGGVRVTGWNQSTYSVKACKAGDARISSRGDEVSADVPEDSDAVVYFLVRAPRNGSLDLEAFNGELGVQDFNGTLNARTTNGPISLSDVSGTITAEAHNGPISFKGGSGVVKLDAQNGPITVKLDGNEWLGGSLDAHSHNGPMSVKVSNDYRSGVVVESNGHGPVSCRAEACRQARRTWDDDMPRRIELGSGPAVVRLSTVNGPVSVGERD